jgi:CDP-glucose 4,6-dehydratase
MESVVIRPTFWNGKRVFVTGHTGFKGSWLSLWLQELGAHVTGYSLPAPTQPSLFDLAGVGERMNSLIGDVRDLDRLSRGLREQQPCIVFHLAAQPIVRDSYTDPVGTYATNVMGTVHLLEATRHVPSIKAVVVVSSDKCYENHEWERGYHEDDAMGGFDPYSSSKGCTELVTAAYRRSFFQQKDVGRPRAMIASGRAGNVIGGGDWAAGRLVPDMMRAFASNQSVLIRNPRSIRPWQHVLEPLSGYLMLAERLIDADGFDEAWNFGPDETDSRSVAEIADALVELWGEGASWTVDQGAHPHEAHSLRLNSSKARQRLGWAPHMHVTTALEWVVEWYRGYASGDDVRQLTVDQIARYQGGAA